MTPGSAARAEYGLALVAESMGTLANPSASNFSLVDEETSGRHGWLWLSAAALLAATLAIVWFVTTRTPDFGDVVAVPAGSYVVTDSYGAATTAVLAAYQIDRTEVTNQQYGACYGAGQCPYPSDRSAPGRDDYFLDSAFANYPVASVTWDAATTYCAWRSMRLPSAAEFEVAARFAPLTDRMYQYPWGDLFSSAYVVGADDNEGTAEVGRARRRATVPSASPTWWAMLPSGRGRWCWMRHNSPTSRADPGATTKRRSTLPFRLRPPSRRQNQRLASAVRWTRGKAVSVFSVRRLGIN